MWRSILLATCLACNGTVEVVDPGAPTPPAPPTSPGTPLPPSTFGLVLDLEFLVFKEVGSCAWNPSGEIWVELAGPAAVPSQIVVMPCAERVTAMFEPSNAGAFRVSTMEYGPETMPAEYPEPSQITFESGWIDLVVEPVAGESYSFYVALDCYEHDIDDGCGGA